MILERKPFELPMALTIGFRREKETGKVVAHSLDFDLVCVGNSDKEAVQKIRLAVKTYVEFGLSNDWAEEILFPAPTEYWDQLRDANITVMGDPINVMARRMLVYRATPSHEVHEALGAPVPA